MPTLRERTISRMWSIGVLISAAVSFPYVCAVVITMAAWHRITNLGTKKTVAPNAGTAIVTGGKMTKSLCMCRHLKRAGYRVVLVETEKYWMVASRFTSSVDRFVTTPTPEKATKEHLQAIKQLAYEENASLFVPVTSPVASIYEARVASVLPPGCRSLSLSDTVTAALDDKVMFAELAQQCGLAVPEIRRVCSKKEAHAINNELRERQQADGKSKRYIFKNLSYDSMRRLDLFTMPCEPEKLTAYMADIEITKELPWCVNAFVKGTEYSTCALAHDGAITMYTDNHASISCFNYKYAGDQRLRQWVEKFCKSHKLNGILCIDFIIDSETGTAYAIECNPRMSSNITNFYSSPTLFRAFLDPDECARRGIVETPLPSALETNWIFVDLYYALRKPGLTLAQRAREIYEAFACKKDAYFDPADVMPFLALHYLHIPVLLARNVWRGNRWAKIDMCIGKMTEENGD